MSWRTELIQTPARAALRSTKQTFALEHSVQGPENSDLDQRGPGIIAVETWPFRCRKASGVGRVHESVNDEQQKQTRETAGQPGWRGGSGRERAVRRVLVESYRDLRGFLRRRLGNESEAEEVLQDFMLRALERADDLRDVRSVRGWLSRLRQAPSLTTSDGRSRDGDGR